MDRFGIAGERDVPGRRLVHVQPARMRVVDAEEFEPALAKFPHQAHHLLGPNQIIPDRISRDVFRRERSSDYVELPRDNSAAFSMRMAAGMLQELPKYFPATSDSSLHFSGVYRET